MKMDYFIIYGRTVIVRMLVSTQERCIDIIGLLSRGNESATTKIWHTLKFAYRNNGLQFDATTGALSGIGLSTI